MLQTRSPFFTPLAVTVLLGAWLAAEPAARESDLDAFMARVTGTKP